MSSPPKVESGTDASPQVQLAVTTTTTTTTTTIKPETDSTPRNQSSPGGGGEVVPKDGGPDATTTTTTAEGGHGDDVIEPATAPLDEDEFEPSEGYDASSLASVSVTSSVFAHTYENGRRYQSFKNGRYPIPNDDQEQAREDMKHAMLMELTDGALCYAPIGDNPQKILDVGTGTGIWAIDAGDRFPSADVQGIDLSPIQPLWVPPNVSFYVDDCEKEWLVDDLDFVHFRFMAIILKDVPNVLENAYKSIRPGGWIEFQDLDGHPLCDDGTMTDEDPVRTLYGLAGEAYAKFGFDVRRATKLGDALAEAGFVNAQRVVRKVPIGTWARDKTLRLVGMYQKLAIADFMQTLAGRPFAALGLSPEEGQVRLAWARRGLEDRSVHRYFDYYFWYAQKPDNTPEGNQT